MLLTARTFSYPNPVPHPTHWHFAINYARALHKIPHEANFSQIL